MGATAYAAVAVVALLLAVALVAARARACGRGARRAQGMAAPRYVCDPERRECTQALWRIASEPSWATVNECIENCGRETLRRRVARAARPDAENVFPYGRTQNGAPPAGGWCARHAVWFVSPSAPALTGDSIEDASAVLRPGSSAEYGAVKEMAAY